LHNFWTLLIAIPEWGFLRYQSWKDPLFLNTFAGQLRYKQYYTG
jgi:type IV secretory pathway TrbD component